MESVSIMSNDQWIKFQTFSAISDVWICAEKTWNRSKIKYTDYDWEVVRISIRNDTKIEKQIYERNRNLK